MVIRGRRARVVDDVTSDSPVDEGPPWQAQSW
jgi:hypothetical protein